MCPEARPAYPGMGEELSLKAPAASKCQLGFCHGYSQFLPSDWFFCAVQVWRMGGGLPSSFTWHHVLVWGIRYKQLALPLGFEPQFGLL